MRIAIKSLAFVLAIALIACDAQSPYNGTKKILFRPVSRVKPSSFTTLLQFGYSVPDAQRDYPASFAAMFDPSVECSATLVGADSILTARHCVDMASSGGYEISVQLDGEPLAVRCTKSETDDIALCQSDKNVDGVTFDVISREAAYATRGRLVQLTGWAEPAASSLPSQSSSQSSSWFQQLKGGGPQFQEGTGRIVGTGHVLSVLGDWANGGRVVIEEGDSGGAAYVFENARRKIIGVNVCGGKYCFGQHSTDGTTKLTNVTDQRVSDFIDAWAREHSASLCGYTSTKGCRS